MILVLWFQFKSLIKNTVCIYILVTVFIKKLKLLFTTFFILYPLFLAAQTYETRISP